jgi:hypothetical protein
VRLHRRLERLEGRIVDAGCPACRHRRGKAVYLEEGDERPARCARCGKTPELVIDIRRASRRREMPTALAPERHQTGVPR